MLMREDGLIVLTDMDALTEPLPSFLAYWERKRAGRLMPAPSDIVPAEIPRLLPYLTIADVTYEPLDFRYRLVGTRLVDMAGADRTGVSLREGHSGRHLEERLEALRTALQSPAPLALAGRFDWLGRDYRRFECIQLPLSEDGERVSRIVAAYAFP